MILIQKKRKPRVEELILASYLISITFVFALKTGNLISFLESLNEMWELEKEEFLSLFLFLHFFWFNVPILKWTLIEHDKKD